MSKILNIFYSFIKPVTRKVFKLFECLCRQSNNAIEGKNVNIVQFISSVASTTLINTGIYSIFRTIKEHIFKQWIYVMI